MAQAQLTAALMALVNAQTPRERAAALIASAETLLGDDARRVIAGNVERARAAGDAQALGAFESVLPLLDLCRQQGVEAGVELLHREQVIRTVRAFLGEAWGGRRRLLDAHEEKLLSEVATQQLEHLLATNRDRPAAVSHVLEAMQVLEDVRARGVAATFAGIREGALEQLADAAAQGRRSDAKDACDVIRELSAPDEWIPIHSRIVATILEHAPLPGAVDWAGDEAAQGLANLGDPTRRGELRIQLAFQLMRLQARDQTHYVDAAIEAYTLALADFATSGVRVSGLHGKVGQAFMIRPAGVFEDNLARAREHFELELQHSGRDPAQTAFTHVGLGHVNSLLGDRERAIYHLERALYDGPPTPEAEVQPWLMLANLRMEQQGATRGASIEAAIRDLEQAAAIPEEGTTSWAMVQRNLGDVWRQRQEGVPADNSAHARRCAERALSVFTRDRFADDWAQLQHNLGTICYGDVGGEGSDNIEQALAHYRSALEVHTREAFPQYFGLTSAALGAALLLRTAESRVDNLSDALVHLRAAEATLDREASKRWWAECQSGLGVIHRQRLIPDRVTNLRLALEHLDAARLAYVELGDVQRECQALSNMAAVYLELAPDDPTAIERAAQLSNEALARTDQASDPYHWAMFHRNLAGVLSRMPGSGARAFDALARALEVFTPEVYLREYRQAQSYVGHLHFDDGQWRPALTAYEASIDASAQLLAAAYTDPGRRGEVAETQLLYARAAYCLVRLGRKAEALETLEAGKTILLAEALAASGAELSGVPDALVARFQAARLTINAAEREMRQPPQARGRNAAEIGVELRRAREVLTGALAEIRRHHPQFLATRLGVREILDVAPDGGALVAWLLTSHGGVAFVVEHGADELRDDHVVDLPDASQGEIDLLLDERHPDSWMSLLRASDAFEGPAPLREWMAAMHGFLDRLWDAFIAPVYRRLLELRLEADAPLIVLPHGGLGMLPLHVASRTVRGTRRYLTDDFVVTYAPSAFWRRSCVSRSMRNGGDERTLLAVIDPSGDLPYAGIEGEWIAPLFDRARTLAGPNARRGEVLRLAQDARYLHFACHGAYDWDDVMHSSLRLAEPDRITISDVLAGHLDLEASRLVVLSACESGLTGFRISPDEYIGLPAAFMVGGATGVISSLWEVEDAATALLMWRLHQEHAEHAPAQSLVRAQRWLRGLTAQSIGALGPMGAQMVADYRMLLGDFGPDDHILDEPFFWAGFMFNGG